MAKSNSSWRLFNGGISKCSSDSTAWKRFKEQLEKKAKAEREAKNWADYVKRRKEEGERCGKAKRTRTEKKATSSIKMGYNKAIDFGAKIMFDPVWMLVGSSLTFLGRAMTVKSTYDWLTDSDKKEKQEMQKENKEIEEQLYHANEQGKKKLVAMVMKQHLVMESEWQTWKKESEELLINILKAPHSTTDAPTPATPPEQ